MFLLIFQSKSIIKKLQQKPRRTASLMSSNLASVVSGDLFLREHSMFILKYFPQNKFPKGYYLKMLQSYQWVLTEAAFTLKSLWHWIKPNMKNSYHCLQGR